jgi:predicted nucleic acid-binding protein
MREMRLNEVFARYQYLCIVRGELVYGAALHNLIVVTHNTREFSRIPGLKVEDWEE